MGTIRKASALAKPDEKYSMLAAEHHEDLRRSGLNDATVETLHFRAVRPHDIKIQGVESAYSIPYFNVDGSVNCFERRKLFPPHKTNRGTQKYWQPPNTSPHLYLPPLVDWQTVATNATMTVTVAEGEKKAAAGCQNGLVTAGIGGVWSWRSTLDSGDVLTLPMLDQFQWSNRSVVMCPDSDAWHDGKEMTILAGFFALAKELQSRSAIVLFVRLPDIHGTKVGLDDWLGVPGTDIEYSWPKLERFFLDDPRFYTLTAWWQKWREKQATKKAIRERIANDLSLTDAAGLILVRSAAHSLTMTFERLNTQRGGIIAEVSITVGSTDLRSGIDLNLKSVNAQTLLAGSLSSLCQDLARDIPWKVLIPGACALVLKRYRHGAPLLRIDKDTYCEPLTFIVNPLVIKRKPTVVFADGGKGKSTLALMVALLVSTGGTIAGVSAMKGRALYLDWEDSEEVHTRRTHALQEGHPELIEGYVMYLRCTERLARMVPELARLIQREQITFLVVDSLLAAAGGGSDAEATEQFFAALRVLNIATLIIGHTPKTLAEGQESPTIYGSVFNSNFSRSTWEVRTKQQVGEDCAILGLFHRKTNLTRKLLPLGLKVRQKSDGTFIRYESFDLNQAAEIKKALPLHNRIRNLLESDGVSRSSKEIADELGRPLESIKATLSNARYKGIKWHMLGEGREAQWTVKTDR